MSLASTVKIVNGGTPDTKVAEYWDGGVPWLTPKDMGQAADPYVAQTSRTISAAGLQKSSARLVPAGSVILSTRAPIGHLAISTVEMAFNQGCRGLVPGKYINAKYLFYFLGANVDLLNKLGTGATFKELSAGALGDVTIPVPPFAEQQRIVAVLDKVFEAAGSAITKAEQGFEYATTFFEMTRRALFSEQEREWGTKPITSICENLDGRRRPVTKHDREPGDVPYYGASGVVDHVRDHLFDEDLLLVSEDGANLLMRTYPIAFSITGPAWVNNHAHVLRFPTRSTQSFVEHYLNSIDLKPYVSGMAQPKLNQGALNAIEVPMPSLDVQKAIIAKLDALQTDISSLSSIYTRKLASLASLKQSLLAYAFSGELVREEPTAANDNPFAKPEQVANVLAVLHARHEQIGREKTFGRVKAQKGLHLMESVGRVELGRTPWKDVAGPNDFPHMLAAEGWAKAQAFFQFDLRPDGGYDFVKLKNYRAMLKVARDALKPIDDAVRKVIDLIGALNSREAEVLATVHAAWNNLILDGIETDDNAIIREARDEWHAKKLRIPETMFRDAIGLIRRKSIVPDGSAKRVAHMQPKLL